MGASLKIMEDIDKKVVSGINIPQIPTLMTIESRNEISMTINLIRVFMVLVALLLPLAFKFLLMPFFYFLRFLLPMLPLPFQSVFVRPVAVSLQRNTKPLHALPYALPRQKLTPILLQQKERWRLLVRKIRI